MSQSYYRCTHCRGFYETDRTSCKWCSYDAPQLEPDGEPKVYPDRETARAIQLEEYKRLPKEAHDDPMGPPMDNPTLRCACLHCGDEGHVFEAIEMRWLDNEQFWACPCTTCGGRGFEIDIHAVDPIWQCADCGHWYNPEKLTSKYANCPKCGSKRANGWFVDEDEDGEPIEDDEWDEDEEDWEALAAGEAPIELPDEESPWQDDVEPFSPSASADDEGPDARRDDRIPDDIDFPRHFDRDKRKFDENDIPF